jgi:hypothetical protein
MCFTFLVTFIGFLVRQNFVWSSVFILYNGPNVLCGPKDFRIDCMCTTFWDKIYNRHHENVLNLLFLIVVDQGSQWECTRR